MGSQEDEDVANVSIANPTKSDVLTDDDYLLLVTIPAVVVTVMVVVCILTACLLCYRRRGAGRRPVIMEDELEDCDIMDKHRGPIIVREEESPGGEWDNLVSHKNNPIIIMEKSSINVSQTLQRQPPQYKKTKRSK